MSLPAALVAVFCGITFALAQSPAALSAPAVPSAASAPQAAPAPPTDFHDTVQAAMMPSLDQQRQSVRQQAALVKAVPASSSSDSTGSDFFTTPWPRPVEMQVAQPLCDPMPKDDVDSLVDTASKQEGVKPELVRAVMRQESGFRPCVISSKGAQGLMQMMTDTATQIKVSDPFDPKQNVEGGTKLLKQLLDKYNGNVALALGAYNAGSGRVDKEGGVPSIPETMNYVEAIMAHLPH